MPNQILRAALDYAALGWLVFPVFGVTHTGKCECGVTGCKDAGKHPRTSNGLKAATTDPEQIREWFPDVTSNLAVRTGAVSDITVVDVDTGPEKLGAETWAGLIQEHGEIETLMAQTGSGGMHVIFRYNSAVKTANNVFGPGIDCRNDGGYIVAPPSLHRSGKRYQWLIWPMSTAALPAHLVEARSHRGRPLGPARRRYTLQQVEDMLTVIPADDRDLWRSVGIILGREYERSPEAWRIYTEWAGKWTGKKSSNHDTVMLEAFHEISQQQSDRQVSIGTIARAATAAGWAPQTGNVPIDQFVFYGPGNNYIYRPTASYWVATAVNAAVSRVNVNGRLQQASAWLQTNQLATSMTSDPALDGDYIIGKDCRNGEIVEAIGAAIFNTYRPSTIVLGESKSAVPFTNHVQKIFDKPGDADQFLDYMAHRVQRAWEKPRFALMIAGGQGTGKDTAVEFCCPAIGQWNVANIEPQQFDSGFNEFVASALVRISEAANLHEMTKWVFNERTKVLISGVPDICTINPKYGQKYSVRMYCGVIITTNHLASGIFIPQDDRRYDVIETATLEQMGLEQMESRRQYFTELWEWFNKDGAGHVAAFLNERNISKFSASNGQRKTDAHHTVVATGMTGDQWLDDILSDLANPAVVRADTIVNNAIATGERDMDVRRRLANAMGRAGYTLFRNPRRKDGRWPIDNRKVTVYALTGTAPDIDTINSLKRHDHHDF